MSVLQVSVATRNVHSCTSIPSPKLKTVRGMTEASANMVSVVLWWYCHLISYYMQKMRYGVYSFFQGLTADTDTQEGWFASTTWWASVRKENPVNLCSTYLFKFDSCIMMHSSFKLFILWYYSAVLVLSCLWELLNSLHYPSKAKTSQR